jgi:hypothetical protein
MNFFSFNSEEIILQAYDQIRICRKQQKKNKTKNFSHIINSAYEKIKFHKLVINYNQINRSILTDFSQIINIDDEMNYFEL